VRRVGKTCICQSLPDIYPDIQILATGSSTLGASTKFRDTLAGRKTDLWLTPMMSADLKDFGRAEMRHRLLHGGLPPGRHGPSVGTLCFE